MGDLKRGAKKLFDGVRTGLGLKRPKLAAAASDVVESAVNKSGATTRELTDPELDDVEKRIGGSGLFGTLRRRRPGTPAPRTVFGVAGDRLGESR